MAYSTTIGDAQPTAETVTVAALPISVVTQADIADANSAVNNSLLSGKKYGACYIMKETTGELPVIVVATGTATTDAWVRQDDKVEITPA
jgi:hypothetical protein